MKEGVTDVARGRNGNTMRLKPLANANRQRSIYIVCLRGMRREEKDEHFGEGTNREGHTVWVHWGTRSGRYETIQKGRSPASERGGR